LQGGVRQVGPVEVAHELWGRDDGSWVRASGFRVAARSLLLAPGVWGVARGAGLNRRARSLVPLRPLARARSLPLALLTVITKNMGNRARDTLAVSAASSIMAGTALAVGGVGNARAAALAPRLLPGRKAASASRTLPAAAGELMAAPMVAFLNGWGVWEGREGVCGPRFKKARLLFLVLCCRN
jgi:hypothetical protein